jgi:hypothetical protein
MQYKLHHEDHKHHIDYGASVNGINIIGLNNGDNLVDEKDCVSNNGIWDFNTQKCKCQNPFYGPNCDLQSHDETYLGIGFPLNDTDVTMLTYESPVSKGEDEIQNVPLSFNSDSNGAYPLSCTALCDEYNSHSKIYDINRDEDVKICYGVSYSKGRCGLITDPIKVNNKSNIYYDSQKMSTIYLNTKIPHNYPIFLDRIFAFESVNPQLNRFWIGSNTGHIREIVHVGRKVTLPFNIKSYLNQTGKIGIWSSTDFNESDFQTLITNPTPGMFVDWGHDSQIQFCDAKHEYKYVYYSHKI